MKKKKSIWLKKSIVYLIAISFILPVSIGLIEIINELDNDDEIQANILATTSTTTLDVALSSSYEVGQYIFTGHYGANMPYETNMSVAYDNIEDACKLTVTRNNTGQFVFSGFTPALRTQISFEFKQESYGFNGAGSGIVNYLFCGGVTNQQSFYKLDIPYYDSGGGLHTWQKDSTIWGVDGIPWVRYTLNWYPDRTFQFQYYDVENSNLMFSGWNKTRQNFIFDKPDSLFPSFFLYSFSPSGSADYETDYSMYIRNLKQIVYGLGGNVQAISPSSDYAGWGMDGLYENTYVNDTDIITDAGGKTTIFYDLNLKHPEGGNPQWTEGMMADLFSRDYEMGIHLNNSMAVYDDATTADLNYVFTELYDLALDNGWTQSSIAFSSYGNEYNYSYNDYVYNEYDNSIGRKLWSHDYANLGHLFGIGDTPNTMVLNSAERGYSYIGYYHQSTGEAPDVDYADFRNLINETIENDLSIVGYIEYWAHYSAPQRISGSIANGDTDFIKIITVDYADLILPENVKIEIRVSESALDILPLDAFTLTQNGVTLSYESIDGWIVFSATEGEIALEKEIFILYNIKPLLGTIGFFGLIILPAVSLWSVKQNSESGLTFGKVSMVMIVLFGLFVYGFFM